VMRAPNVRPATGPPWAGVEGVRTVPRSCCCCYCWWQLLLLLLVEEESVSQHR
jgi:hypothetical protein